MEMLLAAVALIVGLALARRRYLHPGDFLVAAAIVVTFAAFVLVLIPDPSNLRVLGTLGAPATARTRATFLVAHGAKIVLASMVCAAGYVGAAVVRRRASPGQFAWT